MFPPSFSFPQGLRENIVIVNHLQQLVAKIINGPHHHFVNVKHFYIVDLYICLFRNVRCRLDWELNRKETSVLLLVGLEDSCLGEDSGRLASINGVRVTRKVFQLKPRKGAFEPSARLVHEDVGIETDDPAEKDRQVG